MSHGSSEGQSPAELRLRALARLSGSADAGFASKAASAAFGVLHGMAASPATAADALAVLHELQVHQVELELQAEELARTRAELELALRRQIELYDSAPVGLLVIDGSTALQDINLSAAALLERSRDELIGHRVCDLLTEQGARDLRAMLADILGGTSTRAGRLELNSTGGRPRAVQAWVKADPSGPRFLVGIAGLQDH